MSHIFDISGNHVVVGLPKFVPASNVVSRRKLARRVKPEGIPLKVALVFDMDAIFAWQFTR